MSNYLTIEELDTDNLITWVIALKDDREFVFYFSNEKYKSKLGPLTEIREFDFEEFWSVDIDGGNDFDRDPLDHNLKLIPKKLVRRVYSY